MEKYIPFLQYFMEIVKSSNTKEHIEKIVGFIKEKKRIKNNAHCAKLEMVIKKMFETDKKANPRSALKFKDVFGETNNENIVVLSSDEEEIEFISCAETDKNAKPESLDNSSPEIDCTPTKKKQDKIEKLTDIIEIDISDNETETINDENPKISTQNLEADAMEEQLENVKECVSAECTTKKVEKEITSKHISNDENSEVVSDSNKLDLSADLSQDCERFVLRKEGLKTYSGRPNKKTPSTSFKEYFEKSSFGPMNTVLSETITSNFAKKRTTISNTNITCELFTRRSTMDIIQNNGSDSDDEVEYLNLSSDDENTIKMRRNLRNESSLSATHLEEMTEEKEPQLDPDSISIISDSDSEINILEVSKSKPTSQLQSKELPELHKLREMLESELQLPHFAPNNCADYTTPQPVTPYSSLPNYTMQPMYQQEFNKYVKTVPVNPKDPRFHSRLQRAQQTQQMEQTDTELNKKKNISPVKLPIINQKEILEDLGYKPESPATPTSSSQIEKQTVTYKYKIQRKQIEENKKSALTKKSSQIDTPEIAKVISPLEKAKKIAAPNSVMVKVYQKLDSDVIPKTITEYKIPKKGSNNMDKNNEVTNIAEEKQVQKKVISLSLNKTKETLPATTTIAKKLTRKSVLDRRRSTSVNFQPTEKKPAEVDKTSAIGNETSCDMDMDDAKIKNKEAGKFTHNNRCKTKLIESNEDSSDSSFIKRCGKSSHRIDSDSNDSDTDNDADKKLSKKQSLSKTQETNNMKVGITYESVIENLKNYDKTSIKERDMLIAIETLFKNDEEQLKKMQEILQSSEHNKEHTLKNKGRTARELKNLNNDLKNMYDCDKILACHGKRQCTIKTNEKIKSNLKLRSCSDDESNLKEESFSVKQIKNRISNRRKSSAVDRKLCADLFDSEQSSDEKEIQSSHLSPTEQEYETDDYSAHLQEKRLKLSSTKCSNKKLHLKQLRVSLTRLTQAEIEFHTKQSTNSCTSSHSLEPPADQVLIALKATPLPFQSPEPKKRNTKKHGLANISKANHCRNPVAINSCLICLKKSKNLVSHYVNAHLDSEVFIARISAVLIEQFKETRNYGYPVEDSTSKFRIYCMFCKEHLVAKIGQLYEHYASHTGEFAYQCNECCVKYPFEKQIQQHCKIKCSIKNVRYSQMYAYNKDLIIVATFCSLCNFIQLNRANVERHLKHQHNIFYNYSNYLQDIVLVELKIKDNLSTKVTIENEKILEEIDEIVENEDGRIDPLTIESIIKEEDEFGSEKVHNHNNATPPSEKNTDITEINNSNKLQIDENTVLDPIIPMPMKLEYSSDDKPNIALLDEILEEKKYFLETKNSIILAEIEQKFSSIEAADIKIPVKSLFESNTPIEKNQECQLMKTEDSTIICLDSDDEHLNDDSAFEKPSTPDIIQEIPYTEKSFTVSKVPSTVNNMFDIRIENAEICNDETTCILKPWLNFIKIPKVSNEKSLKILEEVNLYHLFKCILCPFSTNVPLTALEHYEKHEKDNISEVNNHECPYCVYTNNTAQELVNHIQSKHRFSLYQCSQCFYRSCSAFGVKFHQRITHTANYKMQNILFCNGSELSVIKEFEDIISSRSAFVKPYKCHLCNDGKKVYIQDCMEKHFKNGHNNATYCKCDEHEILACLYCFFEAPNKTYMLKHIVNNHPEKSLYACVRILNNKYKEEYSDKPESTVLISLGGNVQSKYIKVDSNLNTECPQRTDNNLKRRKELRICASNCGEQIIDRKNITNEKLELDETNRRCEEKSIQDLQHEFEQLANLAVAETGIPTAKLYKCSIESCSDILQNFELWKNHLQKTHKIYTEKYKCPHCAVLLPMIELINHFTKHSQHKYFCYLCSSSEITYNGIERHLNNDHSIYNSRIIPILPEVHDERYYAVIKSGVFFDVFALTKHMCNILKLNPKVINAKQKLIASQVSIISPKVDGNRRPSQNKMIPIYVPSRERYQCNYNMCKLKIINESAFEYHFNTIHRRFSSFSCGSCEFVIPLEIKDFRIIKDHLRMHSENIYVCCKCNLSNHMRQVVSEHVWKTHKTDMNITKIQRKIKNDKLFCYFDTCLGDGYSTLCMEYCIICAEKMSSADKIDKHLATAHNCVVNYQCRYCKKQSSSRNDISRHIHYTHKQLMRIRCIYETEAPLQIDSSEDQPRPLSIASPPTCILKPDKANLNMPIIEKSIDIIQNKTNAIGGTMKRSREESGCIIYTAINGSNNKMKKLSETEKPPVASTSSSTFQANDKSNSSKTSAINSSNNKMKKLSETEKPPVASTSSSTFQANDKSNSSKTSAINSSNNKMKKLSETEKPPVASTSSGTFKIYENHQNNSMKTSALNISNNKIKKSAEPSVPSFFTSTTFKPHENHQNNSVKTYIISNPNNQMSKLAEPSVPSFFTSTTFKPHENHQNNSVKTYIISNPINQMSKLIEHPVSSYHLSTNISENVLKRVFVCDACDYKSISYENIFEHKKHEHDNAVGFSCEECNKIYKSIAELREHKIAIHSFPIKKLHCSHCIYVCLTMRELNNHNLATHRKICGFLCEKCHNFYDTFEMLRSHQISKCDKTTIRQYEFKCIYCEFVAKTSEEVKHHYKKMHINKPELKDHKKIIHPYKCAIKNTNYNIVTPAKTVMPAEPSKISSIRLVPINLLLEKPIKNSVDVCPLPTNETSDTPRIDNGTVQTTNTSNCKEKILSTTAGPMNRTMLPDINFAYKNDLVFACDHCKIKFIDMAILIEHWFKNHTTDRKLPFQYTIQRRLRCSRCDFTGSFQEIKQHHLQCHIGVSLILECNTNQRSRQCVECCYECNDIYSLDFHICNEHPDLKNQTELNYNFVSSEMLDSLLKIGYLAISYKCEHCGYSFLEENLCQQHLREKHENLEPSITASLQTRIYCGCTQCQVFYDNQKNGFIHFRQIHTKPYICVICSENIANYSLLQIHYKDVHKTCTTEYNCTYIVDTINDYTKNLYILFPNGLVMSLYDLSNTQYGSKVHITKLLQEIEKAEFSRIAIRT